MYTVCPSKIRREKKLHEIEDNVEAGPPTHQYHRFKETVRIRLARDQEKNNKLEKTAAIAARRWESESIVK